MMCVQYTFTHDYDVLSCVCTTVAVPHVLTYCKVTGKHPKIAGYAGGYSPTKNKNFNQTTM